MAKKETKNEIENQVDDELEDGIIELVDDQNNVLKYKLLDVTEYKGEKYTILLPAEGDEDDEEGDEVVIFRLNEEQEVLEPIEDEKLLEEVFEFFQNETEGEEIYSDDDDESDDEGEPN